MIETKKLKIALQADADNFKFEISQFEDKLKGESERCENEISEIRLQCNKLMSEQKQASGVGIIRALCSIMAVENGQKGRARLTKSSLLFRTN